MDNRILENNRTYWNSTADEWVGATALPEWGVQFVTEEELHLFGDVAGKKLLEIGCGSGHSLKYLADRGAEELWGLDLSATQIRNAESFLSENHCYPKLICSPMEADCGIPQGYFDIVYSVYAIGWTTDLAGTFRRIAGYLKEGGVFLFSWKHSLHGCVAVEGDALIFQKSYFDEEWHEIYDGDHKMLVSNRRISTYVNALAEAGFVIERMVEQTDSQTFAQTEDRSDRTKKAQKLPLSFIFRARKQ